MKSILVLKFTSFMQSYGHRSKWEHRDTSMFPTKSSIVGLLGCAFGYTRDNNELNILNDKLKVHVRLDKKGDYLSDFQTVMDTVYMENGKEKSSAGSGASVLTTKQYLSDAIFTVFIEGDREYLDNCVRALKNPAWPLYLGRKAYPINFDFLLEVVDGVKNTAEFIENYPISEAARVLQKKKDVESIRFDYFLENAKGSILLTDSLNTQGQKFYGYRAVTRREYRRTVGEIKNEAIPK